ncbi:MAG: MBL fold metallo-hydrolase [Desulforhopalus sp.]
MNTSSVHLKILVDNVAAPGLVAEHGFSLLIEAENKMILFDTGQGKALASNANTLNVDLAATDLLILSHGHYDHTGGLPLVLHPPYHLHVYCHGAAFLPRYSIVDGVAKPVKMVPEAMISINTLPEENMHWVAKPLNITDALGVTGEIPRTNDFENTGGAFYFDQDGKRADPIKDDMAVWIKTPHGLVICIGCCHAGIINTLDYILGLTGETTIHTLIGGLHLLNADRVRLEKTLARLQQFNINQIIPCHCTGDDAHRLLMKAMPCLKGYAGMEIHI